MEVIPIIGAVFVVFAIVMTIVHFYLEGEKKKPEKITDIK